MRAPVLTKFGFRIRTRLGMVVDNLMIHGSDEEAAMRKLRQMYHGCEILECVRHDAPARAPIVNFEDVAGLIVAR
jgi:hypothetical protein